MFSSDMIKCDKVLPVSSQVSWCSCLIFLKTSVERIDRFLRFSSSINVPLTWAYVQHSISFFRVRFSSDVSSFLIWTWWLLISFISASFFFATCSASPVFLSTVSILLINALWFFMILISSAVMISVTLSIVSLRSLKCCSLVCTGIMSCFPEDI